MRTLTIMLLWPPESPIPRTSAVVIGGMATWGLSYFGVAIDTLVPALSLCFVDGTSGNGIPPLCPV